MSADTVAAVAATDAPRVIKQRMLVAGGFYGNLAAFEQLLTVIKCERFAPEQLVLTGDLIAYCAEGAAVAAYCREHWGDSVMVRGNCERALAEDLDDCACGFEAGTVCKALSESWFAYARRHTDDSLKQWMGALPSRADIIFGGKRIAVIHAGSDADNTFIFASDVGSVAPAHLAALQSDGVITGHCGIPFTQQINNGNGGGQLWHNSGAVGMPANDGTPRTWFSVWEERDDTIIIRHRALHYDPTPTIAAMRSASLPEAYQKTLTDGILPSDSVLPDAEKQMQGVALNFADVTYYWD